MVLGAGFRVGDVETQVFYEDNIVVNSNPGEEMPPEGHHELGDYRLESGWAYQPWNSVTTPKGSPTISRAELRWLHRCMSMLQRI